MAPKRKSSTETQPPEVDAVVATLRRLGTKAHRDGLARFAIPSERAFGVTMGAIQKLAKQLGRNHELSAALWDTEWYEARLLTAFLDEPDRVTPSQMDRWCRDFDNWAVCDTLCFHLFDRTPHAFAKVKQWATRREEYVKRAAFALLASVALHDKKADDAAFLRCLPLIERAAEDDRNFVKKGVSWALRLIGRRNAALHNAALDLARRLADSPLPAARWIGRDAVRELTGPVVQRRIAKLGSAGQR